MAPSISVAEYYAGKSIFITGATGFLGIVLVEKLLRSCPDLKTLYLLMRPKKGQSAEERLQEYINSVVFNRIHKECPKNLHKLRLVPGDMLKEELGMSILDQEEVQRECQIVFHCAATVRFDMFIREAVEMNVCGTVKILKFAETMQNLEVFLHMSTAYCHDYLDTLEEKMYTSKHNPHDIINMMKWMDDDTLKTVENKLIHPFPNTYTYTKELSESIVAEYSGKFTIAVARPSITTACNQEPIPGWINNINGPTGLLIAKAKGVFHVMHTHPSVRPDLMPVDIVVNATILLTYLTGLERPKDIRVCNITNSAVNTLSYVEQAKLSQEVTVKYPFSFCVWYPSLIYTESKLVYRILALFMHWLPAVFLDFLLILFRQKPFMIKVQKRLHNGLELLSHYMTGNWIFKHDSFIAMRHQVTPADRETFFTEYEIIDAKEYINHYHLGVREYMCKDPPTTLPKARRLLTFLYYLQLTFNIILVWWFLNFIYYIGMKIFGN
ncbi:putative fatty acyl-CoA reductase CG5065 [Epargyreus clarus]|uniref:putative fatty acyl-CoA reductase CG5065 n=1 Tax=Epargyreus clarus TaxID=520877 RepID=UPI003C2C5EF3